MCSGLGTRIVLRVLFSQLSHVHMLLMDVAISLNGVRRKNV